MRQCTLPNRDTEINAQDGKHGYSLNARSAGGTDWTVKLLFYKDAITPDVMGCRSLAIAR